MSLGNFYTIEIQVSFRAYYSFCDIDIMLFVMKNLPWITNPYFSENLKNENHSHEEEIYFLEKLFVLFSNILVYILSSHQLS